MWWGWADYGTGAAGLESTVLNRSGGNQIPLVPPQCVAARGTPFRIAPEGRLLEWGGMGTRIDARTEMRSFLTSRRARVSPSSAGLGVAHRSRRVLGLRREEVAELAGISEAYYVRLERGRAPGASPEVLMAVSAALRLDPVEARYLFDLAEAVRRESDPQSTPPSEPGRSWMATYRGSYGVTEGRRVMLTHMGVPALIWGPDTTVLAANPLGRALFSPLFDWAGHGPVRGIEFAFLAGRAAHAFWTDHEALVADTIANMRVVLGHYPNDLAIHAVIERLCGVPAFRRVWDRHELKVGVGGGTQDIHHPQAGRMRHRYETFSLDERGTHLDVPLIVPGTPEHAALAAVAAECGAYTAAEPGTPTGGVGTAGVR